MDRQGSHRARRARSVPEQVADKGPQRALMARTEPGRAGLEQAKARA